MAIYGNAYSNTLYGTVGADEIYGYGGNDTLYGGNGSDRLIGGADLDYLDGGDGIDTAVYSDSWEGVTVNLTTGRGDWGGTAYGDTLVNIENIEGSAYGDNLYGNWQANELIGGGGEDWLDGGGGNDILWGGSGNDRLIGGAGGDQLFGGDMLDTDIDTVLYTLSAEGVHVALAYGYNGFIGAEYGRGFGGDAEGDTLYFIEDIHGSEHGDQLVGNASGNMFDGHGGNDWLVGEGGADKLYGGYGDDTLVGGAEADILDGDFGSDTASYASSGGGIWVSLTYGIGYFADAQGDTLLDIENLIGSNFADYLQGDHLANSLSGLDGVDILDGGDDDDMLTGGAGGDFLLGGDGTHDWAVYSDSDTGVWVELSSGVASGGTAQDDNLSGIECLRGSAYGDQLVGDGVANGLDGGGGNDWLLGGAGGDTLTGGMGTDMLMGESGADTFVWTSIAETSTSTVDGDVILDFDGKADHIDLSQIDADETVTGDQAFTIATGAFTGPGQIALFSDYLLLNTDGDSAAEGIIRVVGLSSLDPSWFAF